MDVRTLARRAALANRSLEAVRDGDRRLTFGEMWGRACRLANGLAGHGIRPGDRVAILERNSVASADFLLGCAAGNLVRVALYHRNAPDIHLYMLAQAGCRALVVDEEFAPLTAGWCDQIESLEAILVRRDYERWLEEQSDDDPDPPIDQDDLHLIRYTGGTSGRPRGVAHSHRSWLAGQRDWLFGFPPVEIGDACLHIAPVSHGSGYLFLPVWWAGGRNVMLPDFDAHATIDCLLDIPIAYVFMVPTMLSNMVRLPEAQGRRFPALKGVHVSGAPISDETAKAAHQLFGDVLHQGYGQTECSPITRMSSREWFGDADRAPRLGCAGRPLPMAEIEIRDEAGMPAAPGVIGEIVMRRDSQMVGYWADPSATAEKVREGWVYSGDVGRVDAEGYLWVLDRKDDMIISGGFNIFPRELEVVLESHHQVKHAVVFGIPSARWGETPLAICVVAPNADVTAGQLIDLVVEELGSYKKPSEVLLQTEPLPLTAVGKVDRKRLREPYWAGTTSRIAGS